MKKRFIAFLCQKHAWAVS